MSDMKWYVVNTHSGYEIKAQAALWKRIENAGQEENFGEVLVPVETVIEHKKGEKKTSIRKFFPGYILVRMILTNHTWHVVKNTPKITGFVGGSANPPSMSDDEVKKIISRMENSEAKPDLVQVLEEGGNVRVIDGPFSNFNGVVEQVDQEKDKLRVLVSIFGRVVPVELSFDQVERIVV